LTPALQNFTQTHQGTQVELFDLSTQEILAGLANDELDVGLSVAGHPALSGLSWTTLVRAPWLLAVHTDHPLAAKTIVTPAEVAAEPLLVFCRRDYPEYWDAIMAWLKRHHQRPRIVGECDGIYSLMAAVESSLGLALVASRAAAYLSRRVRLIRLSNPPPPLCIAAGRRSQRPQNKALDVFVEKLRKSIDTVASISTEPLPLTHARGSSKRLTFRQKRG
jgi:DNA-binding transcriptional LysR family regulator